MANPILRITDGTNTVDLIGEHSGLILNDWRPSFPPAKGGGVYRESVMGDGRQLLMRRFENAIESFHLRAHGSEQDRIIEFTQDLIRILQKAVDYWENRWIETPVWLEARGSLETNTRYALIHNYSIDGVDNPYSQPFFSCKPGMETINLAIERGHWFSSVPTSPICTPLIGDAPSSIQAYAAHNVFTGSDDGYVRDALGAGDFTIWRTDTTLNIGKESDTDEFYSFLRFVSVDVYQGVHISSARIDLDLATARSATNDIKVRIYVENNVNPATFSTYDDLISRRWHPEYIEYTLDGGAGSQGDTYTFDITDLVQYIVDLDGWQYNNAMAFKIEPVEPVAEGAIWYFAAYENTTWDEAELIIYPAGDDYEIDQCQTWGKPLAYNPNSCSNESEVFIAPRYNPVGLTHVFYYDASGPSYSGSLLDGNPPYNLFPASPAVGDMVYFGSDQIAGNGGAFFGLAFDFVESTGFGSGTTVVWEVYLGAPTTGWHQLLNGSFPTHIDNTNQFRGECRGLGVDQEHDRIEGRSVHWESLQGDAGAALHGSWQEYSVSSITAYWIRARITAYDSGNVQVESHPRAISTPRVSLQNGDIGGDIPALARARFWYEGYIPQQYNCQLIRTIIGVRTKYPYRDDKAGFCAYIPLQDTFTQDGVKSISLGSNIAYADHGGASNGRCLLFNPSGAETSTVSVSLDMGVFKGRYRCFVRASVSGGTGSDVSGYITIGGQWGIDFTSKTVDIKTKDSSEDPNFFVIDYGLINLPAGSKAILPDNDRASISIKFTTASGTPNIYIESIILIPADEWIGEAGIDYVDVNSGISGRLQYVSFDSLSDFREDFLPIFGEINQYSYEALAERVKGKSAGSFVIAPNKDVDIWFLPIGHDISGGIDHYYSYPQMDFKVRLEVLERYQGMRGDR